MGHDDTARFNFLANANKYLAACVVPGVAAAFVRHASPAFERAHGHAPRDRHEVALALEHESQYRFWSALRRNGMEMRQQAGRSVVMRQAVALRDRARALNAGVLNLRLDAAVRLPRYQAAVDHHCMPGSYHTSLVEDDVSAAANYDCGMYATTVGLFGRFLDGAGRGTAAWVANRRPQWHPRRILDIGCGVGHNTVPVALAWPDAEVFAVDCAAPMLRYAHARARSLGIANIQFVQADAESLPWPDLHFDLVYSTMFLHETSTAALPRIASEINRLVAPGGLTLHLEQPPYRGLPPLEQFLRDWDCRYNNEPFWSALHETDLPALFAARGFGRGAVFEDQIQARVEHDSPKVLEQTEDYGRGGLWYAVGAERSPR